MKAIKNKVWRRFTQNYQNCTRNSKPFWEKINKQRKKRLNRQFQLFSPEAQSTSQIKKANLFANMLQNTFSDSNDIRFDNKYKKNIISKS
jgi:hypothetical protein